jgi:SAM-dependent methyltransferase
MVFDAYAAYYDLLYTDKDYREEAEYVHQLIGQHLQPASSILDLGCGTGKHANEFFKLGYTVAGVDKSARMITIAQQQFGSDNIKFIEADIRSVRTNRKFDVVVSLFHVMSYLTEDIDLEQTFETAAVHLNKQGLFIFDCWYGPGVVDDPPVVTTKKMDNELIEVERIARPYMYHDKKIVNVEFQVHVKQKDEETLHTIKEEHKMRYLFSSEVKSLAAKKGLNVIAAYKWLDLEDIGAKKCWNAVFVLQKQ